MKQVEDDKTRELNLDPEARANSATLSGAALDVWGARAAGYRATIHRDSVGEFVTASETMPSGAVHTRPFSPATDGGNAWELVEKFDIDAVRLIEAASGAPMDVYFAKRAGKADTLGAYGPTRLIAVTRAAVVAAFGRTVPTGADLGAPG